MAEGRSRFPSRSTLSLAAVVLVRRQGPKARGMLAAPARQVTRAGAVNLGTIGAQVVLARGAAKAEDATHHAAPRSSSQARRAPSSRGEPSIQRQRGI